jgi:anti-sigma regulatory factor (Ser/Thr protein kinase)
LNLTTASIRRTLRNSTADLSQFTFDVQAFLADYPTSPRSLYRIELVLEEIVTNVVRHGFGARDESSMEVCLAMEDGYVRLEFLDEGIAFNPLQAAPDAIAGTMQEILVGGRGLQLVRSIVESAQYRRDNGKNHLTLLISRNA